MTRHDGSEIYNYQFSAVDVAGDRVWTSAPFHTVAP
jgi:hypothetical protein